MKKLTCTLGIFLVFLFPLSIVAQDLNSLKSYLDDLSNPTLAQVQRKDPEKCFVKILSDPSLNKLFAQKMAYYLSGGTDVSLFRNYAKYDAADGKTTIGFNFIRPKSDNKYIKRIYNIGLVSDKVGKLFADTKVSNNVGLSFNLTFLRRGTIGTEKDCNDKTIIDAMQKRREFLKESLTKLADNEVSEFKKLQLSNTNFQAFTDSELKSFEKELYKKYRDKFTDDELTYAKDKIKTISKGFVSIGGYLPIKGNDYKFVNKQNDTTTNNFKPWDLYVKGNWFYERNIFNVLVTPTVGVKAYNSATLYTIYADLDESTGKQSLYNTLGVKYDKPNDTYTGLSDYIWLGYWGIKALVTPKFIKGNWLSSFAVAPSYNQTFGKYSIQDLGLDFIFGLPSQDEKGISVNLSLKWLDIKDAIVSEENKKNYFVINLGLAVPLSKLAY
ncbi:hypothetical protein [Emticicia sp. W12TSBA100-4]|uniref:hypothetical protein n=1 Tax=Emticicia sp. W12TSBA100-4 TaxID=3160965 RepID=UPI003305D764